MAVIALRSLAAAATFSLATLTAILPGCGSKKGGLMLAITTDLQTPKDISVVSLTIKAGTAVKHNVVGRVRPDGTVEMPGTIAIVEPDDPNLTIRVRVIAFQDRKPRVLRDIRTTVPRGGRTGLLNVPLTFVNDGSATGELPAQYLPPGPGVTPGLVTEDEFDPYGAAVISVCADPDETVIDGVCKSSFVDSATLPDYAASLVFGEESRGGACFEPRTCLAGAQPIDGFVAATDASGRCSFPLSGQDPVTANLALATSDVGTCLDGRCFVPIDNGDAGWRVVGQTVELAAPFCRLITSKRAELYGAVGRCPAKLSSQPLCSGGASRPTGVDGGVPSNGEGGLPNAGVPELVMPESFVTGVALAGTALYVAGEQGLAVVSDGTPGKQVGQGVINSRPGTRFISGYDTSVAIAEVENNLGFIVSGPATNLKVSSIPFVPPGNRPQGVAYLGAGMTQQYFWAMDSGGPGSVSIAASDIAGATEQAGAPMTRATTIAALPQGQFLFGTRDGLMFHCSVMPPTSVVCGLGDPTGGSGPIEALRSAVVVQQRAAFFLQGNSVYRANPAPTQTGATAFTKLVDQAGVSALTKHGNLLYPRGIVANDKCVFYSSNVGILWVPTGGAVAVAPTVLADLRGAPGDALGVDLGAGPNGLYVYWAFFGTLAQTGGAYRIRAPAECGP